MWSREGWETRYNGYNLEVSLVPPELLSSAVRKYTLRGGYPLVDKSSIGIRSVLTVGWENVSSARDAIAFPATLCKRITSRGGYIFSCLGSYHYHSTVKHRSCVMDVLSSPLLKSNMTNKRFSLGSHLHVPSSDYCPHVR